MTKQAGATAGAAPWARVAVLALAVALCYANSLRAPFLFDDPFLNAPGARLDYSTRPLVWASWDLNRALSGAQTWSYHAFNALVHLACGLLLHGVLRRSAAFAAPGLAARTRDGLACAATLLWLCHPLQTGAVTYLSQRAEALAALFYLGVLYAFLRSAAAARPASWQALALVSLALGFATKETIATAPLAVLLFDALLLAPGPQAALRARPGFYATLALLTLALALVFVVPLLGAGRGAGFGLQEVGALEYARTQPGVILHYLRLAVWPHPLCFDYAWPIARAPADWAWQSALLLAVLAGVALLLARRSWVGLAGACFFLVLAPSSSFVPIKDAAFEHRVYLPLASVLVLLVTGSRWLARRIAPRARLLPHALALSATLALGGLTVRRNEDYGSAVRLMQSTAACAPDNARAHANFGAALLDAGRPAEAVAPLTRSLGLDPHAGLAYLKLGLAYQRLDQLDRALPFFRRAVELIEDARCHDALGQALTQKGDHAGAVLQFEAALRLDPLQGGLHCRLARALAALARRDEAIEHFQEALRLEPGLVEAHAGLAALGAEPGRPLDPAAER
jgi:Flp pilus assembly protein TadD